jgi:hypothetical protein
MVLDGRLSRRALLPLALALAPLRGITPARAQGTPQPASGRAGHLVVADPAAERLYRFRLNDLALDAEWEGMTVNAHAGFLTLPDGRLLFIDETAGELVALQVAGDAGQEIVGRVPVPGPVSHFAVDPGLAYAVVGAGDERQPLTLVNLGSFTARSFDVEAGEAGVMLGGDPLTLFHRNDALMQVESYPVDDLGGGKITPAAVVDTGAAGHGEAIHHDLGRLYLATDDGLDVVEIGQDGLAYRTTVPWAASGSDGGRAYFVRMGEQHLFSYIADRAAAETEWGTWRNDAYVVDLATEQATRVPIGPGLVYRFGFSDRYALFFNVHPDGDNAHLIDTDPASAAFGAVVASIPLDPMTNGPKAGQSPWEAEGRIAAVTPDGGLGFVTHGGDGLISVIDTDAQTVITKLETPTPLQGGGNMIAVQTGMPFTDTVAR